ncbi:MAG: preprotein translocase subunit SecE [Gemmatimonadetes bacterium]|nr:preprotein translocase subunit SecE [Gemmatimonadota bacterium]
MIQKITETKTFIEESWAELQRVTWPDYEQLKNATLVIIAFSVAVSLVIWIMDVSSRTVVNLILRVFGA